MGPPAPEIGAGRGRWSVRRDANSLARARGRAQVASRRAGPLCDRTDAAISPVTSSPPPGGHRPWSPHPLPGTYPIAAGAASTVLVGRAVHKGGDMSAHVPPQAIAPLGPRIEVAMSIVSAAVSITARPGTAGRHPPATPGMSEVVRRSRGPAMSGIGECGDTAMRTASESAVARRPGSGRKPSGDGCASREMRGEVDRLDGWPPMWLRGPGATEGRRPSRRSPGEGASVSPARSATDARRTGGPPDPQPLVPSALGVRARA